ncbi:YqxA family protein [Aquibacillus koreensis]|uniref:YqxA family protein n=1 Tax=Aquibacillus koreensis TaxID=279446 RepID=A0A9X4AGV6_9BACI|nr:YqxA family protein [Aquibacillus koreensis]MCT2537618.1 YqxA family protein [Aquibacillus koreensis]MDC3419064.1 YqxA family protein [Aquibacillus koreensis]
MRVFVTMLLMMVLFLGGVLLGIDKANEGVSNTRGYSTGSFEEAIQAEQTEDGAYEIEVMGEDFKQVSVEEKKVEYEEVQSTHFTQKLAGGLESSVKWFYNQIVQSAYQLAQAFS